MNLTELTDRNPLFETAEDVEDYLKDHEKMDQYSGIKNISLNPDQDLQDAGRIKVRVENYLRECKTFLDKYAEFIDYSKTDYTMDELFKQLQKAREEIMENGFEDTSSYSAALLDNEEVSNLQNMIKQGLQPSGLSPYTWSLEHNSIKHLPKQRHSSCEIEDDENDR